MKYLNELVQEFRVLSQVRSTLDILTLLFIGLPNLIYDTRRIVELLGDLWVALKVELWDVRV